MSDFDIDEHIRKSRERIHLFGMTFNERTSSTSLPKLEPNKTEISTSIIDEEPPKIDYVIDCHKFGISDDTLWGFCLLAENFLKKEQIHQFNEVFDFIKNVEPENKSLDLTRIKAYLQHQYYEYLKSENPLTTREARLFNNLKKWREEKSKEECDDPDFVVEDYVLKNLIKHHPKNKEELLKVKGFAMEKVNKYGEEILKIMTEDMLI